MDAFKKLIQQVDEEPIPMDVLQKEWEEKGGEAFYDTEDGFFFPWHFVPHLLETNQYTIMDHECMNPIQPGMSNQDYTVAEKSMRMLHDFFFPDIPGPQRDKQPVVLPDWYKESCSYEADNPFQWVTLPGGIRVLTFSDAFSSVSCRTEDLEQVLEIVFKEEK